MRRSTSSTPPWSSSPRCCAPGDQQFQLPQQMMKHQVFVFDGDGVGLGEARVALVVGVAEVELEAGVVVDAAAVVFAAGPPARLCRGAPGRAPAAFLARSPRT